MTDTPAPERAADPTPTNDRRREANLLASEIMHAVSYEHAVELAERALVRRDSAFAQAAVEKERERCLWWTKAYAANPKSNPIAREIKAGAPAKYRRIVPS